MPVVPKAPRDRDTYIAKTPAPGDLRTEIDADRPALDADEPSDPEASDFETLTKRAKSAAAHSKSAAISIDALRAETRLDIADQNRRIDTIDTKVGAIGLSVADVSGQMKILVGMVGSQISAANDRQEMALATNLDIKKQTALLPVENAKAKWKLWATVIGGVFSATTITALITTLASGGC